MIDKIDDFIYGITWNFIAVHFIANEENDYNRYPDKDK